MPITPDNARELPGAAMTVTGARLPAMVPSPSWPSELVPQHLTVSSNKRAQVWNHPAATERTPDSGVELPARAMTVTGVRRSIAVPSPSCPPVPEMAVGSLIDEFQPQHLTVLSTRTAQLCSSPTAIAFAPVRGLVLPCPAMTTCVTSGRASPAGVLGSVFVPSPSSP